MRISLVLALLGACSSPSTACRPGELRVCSCPGGGMSSQVCSPASGTFAPCLCESDGGLPASDANITPDANVAPDAGIDASVARYDAGPPRDGGTDVGPPSCTGEGIWRNLDTWCEHLAQVITDYDCDVIWTGATSSGSWSGTADRIRSLTFVLQYDGLSPYADQMLACHAPAPASPAASTYLQSCEVPFTRVCTLAAMYPQYRGGVDYVALCAAAAERGDATIFDLNAPESGCSPPIM